MLKDSDQFPTQLRSDLASFAVKFPRADSASSVRVPPSNLQVGPLTELRFQLGQLAKLHVADGRLSLDRDHWKQASERLATHQATREPLPNEHADPFGSSAAGRDPFDRAQCLVADDQAPHHRWIC